MIEGKSLTATMKQALDALESCGEGHITDGGNQWHDAKLVDTAITSLRQVISELEQRSIAELESQEPIYQYQLASGAWIDQTKESHDYNVRHGQATVRVLYTTPPQEQQSCDKRTWVGLTDEEFWELDKEDLSLRQFVQAVDDRLKEKNT